MEELSYWAPLCSRGCLSFNTSPPPPSTFQPHSSGTPWLCVKTSAVWKEGKRVRSKKLWFQSVRYSKNSISPHCGGELGVADEGGSKVGAHGLGDVFVTGWTLFIEWILAYLLLSHLFYGVRSCKWGLLLLYVVLGGSKPLLLDQFQSLVLPHLGWNPVNGDRPRISVWGPVPTVLAVEMQSDA